MKKTTNNKRQPCKQKRNLRTSVSLAVNTTNLRISCSETTSGNWTNNYMYYIVYKSSNWQPLYLLFIFDFCVFSSAKIWPVLEISLTVGTFHFPAIRKIAGFLDSFWVPFQSNSWSAPCAIFLLGNINRCWFLNVQNLK